MENKGLDENMESEEQAVLDYKEYKANIEAEKKARELKAANHIDNSYESINENAKFLYIVDKLFDIHCPFIIIRTLYLIADVCEHSKYYGPYIENKSEYYGYNKSYVRMEFDYLVPNYSIDGSDRIVHSTFITPELYDDIAYLIDTIILNQNLSIVNDTVMFLFNTTNRLLNKYRIYDIRDIEKLCTLQKRFNSFLVRANKLDDIDYKPLGELMKSIIDDKVIEDTKCHIGLPSNKKEGSSMDSVREAEREILRRIQMK